MKMQNVSKLFTFGKYEHGYYTGLYGNSHYAKSLICDERNIRGLIKRMAKLSQNYISFDYYCDTTKWELPTQLNITFQTNTRNQFKTLLKVFGNVLKVCPIFQKYIINYQVSGYKITYSFIPK